MFVLHSALPSYDTEEVDKDIEGVKYWIDKKREELWSSSYLLQQGSKTLWSCGHKFS